MNVSTKNLVVLIVESSDPARHGTARYGAMRRRLPYGARRAGPYSAGSGVKER